MLYAIPFSRIIYAREKRQQQGEEEEKNGAQMMMKLTHGVFHTNKFENNLTVFVSISPPNQESHSMISFFSLAHCAQCVCVCICVEPILRLAFTFSVPRRPLL